MSTFHQRVYFQQMYHYPRGAATPFFFCRHFWPVFELEGTFRTHLGHCDLRDFSYEMRLVTCDPTNWRKSNSMPAMSAFKIQTLVHHLGRRSVKLKTPLLAAMVVGIPLHYPRKSELPRGCRISSPLDELVPHFVELRSGSD
jgi:hypothetical protein